MEQKQIKQVRECVRRKPLQQILGFLDLIPAVRYGHHPNDSRVPLNLEQQARYCVSQANLLTIQDKLDNAQIHLNWADSLVIWGPKKSESERVMYNKATSGGDTDFNPQYNLNLLKLLRSATKYWIQSAEGRPEGQKPYGYRVSKKWVDEKLIEYNSILGARK